MRWVEQGADWKPHWSFIPPQQDAVAAGPADGLAAQRDRSLRAGDARVERACAPSPEASRETWLRRVTFDLTGLPPTLAEIDAFVADRVAGRLRAGRRSSARVSRLRRADGRRLARRRALRRLARLSGRRHAPDVAVARLGDSAFNRNLPFDRVHHLAARRRSAAERRPRSSGSRPASTATTCRPRKAASSPRNTGRSTSSIA